MSKKFAATSVPLINVLHERWSPRAFDKNRVLTEEQLIPALEAARWAPSAGNSQPSRFVVALRNKNGFGRVLEHLNSTNAHWAQNASALIVNIAQVQDGKGQTRRWAEYDLGQAVAHFSVQAHADGFFVHQMGGFDAVKIAQVLKLPETERVVTVMAVGVVTDPNSVALSDRHLTQELEPRSRKKLPELVSFI